MKTGATSSEPPGNIFSRERECDVDNDDDDEDEDEDKEGGWAAGFLPLFV